MNSIRPSAHPTVQRLRLGLLRVAERERERDRDRDRDRDRERALLGNNVHDGGVQGVARRGRLGGMSIFFAFQERERERERLLLMPSRPVSPGEYPDSLPLLNLKCR